MISFVHQSETKGLPFNTDSQQLNGCQFSLNYMIWRIFLQSEFWGGLVQLCYSLLGTKESQSFGSFLNLVNI